MSITFGFITMGNFTTISSRTLGVRATTCMKYPIWIKSHLKYNKIYYQTTQYEKIVVQILIQSNFMFVADLCKKSNVLNNLLSIYFDEVDKSIQQFYTHGIFSILIILTKENLSMAKHLPLWVPDHIPGIRVGD